MPKKNYRQPLVDIIELEEGVSILVDIPAADKNDIKLEIHRHSLFLTAPMKLNIHKNEKILLMDFHEDIYSVNIQLKTCYDKESLRAYLKNGVLVINLDYALDCNKKLSPHVFEHFFLKN